MLHREYGYCLPRFDCSSVRRPVWKLVPITQPDDKVWSTPTSHSLFRFIEPLDSIHERFPLHSIANELVSSRPPRTKSLHRETRYNEQ